MPDPAATPASPTNGDGKLSRRDFVVGAGGVGGGFLVGLFADYLTDRNDDAKTSDELRGAARVAMAQVRAASSAVDRARRRRLVTAEARDQLRLTIPAADRRLLLSEVKYYEGKDIELLEKTLRNVRSEIPPDEQRVRVKPGSLLESRLRSADAAAQAAIKMLSNYVEPGN